jgi:sodium/hydrogen antiporter
MDSYIIILIGTGIAVLGAVGLPRLLGGSPLSLPIVYVVFGLIAFSLPLGLEPPEPFQHSFVTEKLTELIVIIALMGSGLKLDRRPNLRNWSVALRLLVITMPLCIAAVAGLGAALLGLAAASAVLLGGVLAPTDPVLASDVQVGPPHEGGEDEVRFSLTLEAGLNDGLAFPFTYLAIRLAEVGGQAWFTDWLLFDLLYRVVVGCVAGVVIGLFLAFLVFRLPAKTRLAETGEGLLALAVTLLAYGLTETVEGYGFLAVFVAAVTLRHYERWHTYHVSLHAFTDQFERLLLALLLVLFGGSLAGGLLASLTIQEALLGGLLIFVIRPVAGWIGLIGTKIRLEEKLAIGFFGIRGLGSFYYLAYAINQTGISEARSLWNVVGFTVLLSIFIHGLIASTAMTHLDRLRNRRGETTMEEKIDSEMPQAQGIIE